MYLGSYDMSNSMVQPVDQGGMLNGQEDDGDNSHRPPNAFILYSQDMRSSVRQDHPSLSNIEISKVLGQMWKVVDSETKQLYKNRAQKLQEDFKQLHPDYTYRKARRKRALNELLTKSTQGFGYMMPPGMIPGQEGMQGMPGMPGMQNFFPNFAMNPQMMQDMQGMQGLPGMQAQQNNGSSEQNGANPFQMSQNGMQPNQQMFSMGNFQMPNNNNK